MRRSHWIPAAAFAATTLVIGCAMTPTVSYDEKLAALTGTSAQDLVRAWGPPTATLNLEGGRRQYIYEQRRAPIEPPPAPGGGVAGAGAQSPERRPTLTVEQSCRTTFDVDASGKILGSQYSGSGCGTPR